MNLHFPLATLRAPQNWKNLYKLPTGGNEKENPNSSIPSKYKIRHFSSGPVKRYATDHRLTQMVGLCSICHNFRCLREGLVLSSGMPVLPLVCALGCHLDRVSVLTSDPQLQPEDLTVPACPTTRLGGHCPWLLLFSLLPLPTQVVSVSSSSVKSWAEKCSC